MKKILFVVVAIAAICFTSCGKTSSNASTCDSDSIVVDSLDSLSDSTVVDTLAVDSTVCSD